MVIHWVTRTRHLKVVFVVRCTAPHVKNLTTKQVPPAIVACASLDGASCHLQLNKQFFRPQSSSPIVQPSSVIFTEMDYLHGERRKAACLTMITFPPLS